MRILFLHGRESGPRGTKAVWLAKRYGAVTPQLDTTSMEVATSQAKEALSLVSPELVIGSSFGGAVLVRLLAENAWAGPCLLIAPAAKKLGIDAPLPDGTRALILHGDGDDVVPLADSVALAKTGGPGVSLRVIEGGDHRLNALLDDGTLEDALRSLGATPRG